MKERQEIKFVTTFYPFYSLDAVVVVYFSFLMRNSVRQNLSCKPTVVEINIILDSTASNSFASSFFALKIHIHSLSTVTNAI